MNKKGYFLVGGGEILFQLSKQLIRKNLSVLCLISKRHSAEIINENNLKTNLTKFNIPSGK